MYFNNFTFLRASLRVAGLLSFCGVVLFTGGCLTHNDRNGNGIDDDQEIAEFTAFVSLLGYAWRGGSVGGVGSSTSLCSTDINQPGTISASAPQQAVVGSGVICYYRYASPVGGSGQPSITLITTQGNGDLYVGVRNDVTGGTPESTAATSCTSTSPSDGWIRCAKTTSAVEVLSMNQSGINTLAAGDFRVIAVYANPMGGGSTNFTLLVDD